MSEQKERKHFERQRNRFQPAPRTRGQPMEHEAESSQSSEIRSSQASSIKHDVKQEELTPLQVHTIAEKVTWNFSSQGQEALKRIISATNGDYLDLLKDKVFRQGMRKQQARLTKIRKDQKLTDQTDTELSFLAIGNLLAVSQQIINALKKETEPKEVKPIAKSIVRANQEKEMTKLLAAIDEHLTNNNYLEAKANIVNLTKRFGKDDFIQDRIGSLVRIQNVIELYEKQANLTKQISKYLEKLSSINLDNPESSLQSNTMLKNTRKELTIVINKQKKKADPSQVIELTMTQIEKIATLLSSFSQPKPQKKLAKKESSVSSLEIKGIAQGHQFFEEAARYCSQLLEKAAQDKSMLLKQLEILRKNKKKAGQSPYKLILRLLDIVNAQKKQINDVNLYLKGVSQLYLKKTLSSEALSTESQKLQEKYNSETLVQLKQNLDALIGTVQEKERSGKEINNLQQEIRKLKVQNQRLAKSISEQRSKTIEKPSEEQRVDRKKQMEDKRLKQAERVKSQRLEKDIEKSLDSIYSNLSEKKWKVAKNAINVFVKKFEQASNPLIPSTLRSLGAMSAIIAQLQDEEARLLELEKKEKSAVKDSEKQKELLNDKIRSHEEYEAFLRDLLENYNLDKYPVKKAFEDLRRDRKKIVQERYLLLNKLEQPLNLWRTRNLGQKSEGETKNINLTFSSASGSLTERPKRDKNQYEEKYKQLETKTNSMNKDVEQLLNLIKRIEKGGQWWKFIPKNMKNNAVFKPVYSILEQYRKYELNIQALQANTNIIKEEQKSIQNALDLTITLLSKEQSGFTEGYWQKKLALFKGKAACDKFVTCLKSLTAKLTAVINQERQGYKNELERLNGIITNLQRNLSDRQRSSQMEQSAKKSVDLRSSRRSSRSRDKKQEKSKELVESYIQDERNYLNKIDQVEKEKQHMSEEIISLQLKAQAIEQELIKSEQKVVQLEKTKLQLQKEKYRQFNEINNLKGELEISEGRIHQIQTRLESQVAYFKELSDKVSSRIVEETSKAKELQVQNQTLRVSLQKYKVTSESTHSNLQHGSQQAISQRVQGRVPRFDFELDLGSSKVVDFIDTKPKTSRRRPKQEPQYQQAKQQQPEEVNWQMKVSELTKELNLLKQRLEYEISQTKKLQLIIADLTTENNQLKITLQNAKLNDRSADLLKQIESLQLSNQKLQTDLLTFNESKARQIQQEVRIAIEREVNQFNAFLKKDKEERERYYLNELLPLKLQEEIEKYKASQSPARQIAIDVDSEEFQALYRQKYQKDYESIKKKYESQLQENLKAFIDNEVPIIIEQKKEQWKIEQVGESQELVQNLKKQWQEQMRQEWTTKETAIQQYWSRLLSQKEQQLQQKSELLSRRQASPVKKELSLTDAELLQLLRSQEHNSVTSALLEEQLSEWERKKEIQWQSRERQITGYWENNVLPKLKLQWEQTKRAQIALSNNHNENDLIEQWKSMFLGSIVEYERNSAINYFIEHQLPNILHQEHTKWVQDSFQKNKIEKQTLIRQEWQLWNQTKKDQFEKQTHQFQSRLKEIQISYQNQLIQWQQKLFREQQRSASAEAALKQQRQKWNQQKIELQSVAAKLEAQQHYQSVLASERTTIDQLKTSLANLESQLNEQRAQTYHHSERERQLTEQIAEIQRNFSIRIQNQCGRVLKDSSAASTRLAEQARRQVELQWASKYEKQRQELNRQASTFNEQMANVRGEWQRQKQEQIAKLMESEIRRWEEHKAQEISHILANERQIWQRQHQQGVALIISAQRNKWTKEQETKLSLSKEVSQGQIMQKIEIQCQHRLASAKIEWELQKQAEWTRWVELEKQSWQQLKIAEIQQRIKEVELHWEQHILQEKQQEWKKNQQITIDERVNREVAQVQREFHQVKIPEILQRQYQLWVEESNRNIETERQRWLSSIPELIKAESYRIYLEPLIKAETSQLEQNIRSLQRDITDYQMQIRELESHQLNSEMRIKQLVSQLSEEKLKFEQSVRQKQTMEQELQKIISEHQIATKQTFIETHRINEELTRSKWMEAETNELKKVIESQKLEISTLKSLSKENQLLKRENLSLKETNISIENSKWAEISKLREKLEVQILELSNERNTLLTRITEIETTKHQTLDKESILSFERQIATLLATIKTKDAEISFLKRAIDSHKEELKEARDQYSEAMEQKSTIERQLTEVKHSKMELEYELKYLGEREESLKKKIQSKQQELISYKKKETLQVNTIQKTTKTNLQTLASYQARFCEIESMLSLKTQQCQSKAIELDRLRYDIQRNEATIHSANIQIQSLRMHLKDSQSHFSKLKIEYERNQEELGRTKLSLSQCLLRQEDANKQIGIHVRTIKHEESQKLRLQVEVQRLNDQIGRLWRDLNQSQKSVRIEAERSVQLERQIRQLREGQTRQIDNTELHMLTKINNEVSELTATNRQLTMKIVLLQNQQRIMAFSPEVLKFFLLVQKHTDLLVDHLLRENIIPSLQYYHQFLTESRPYLASGEIGVYFAKWEIMIRHLFEECIRSRAEEMRVQAEQLLRLKEEMNEILEKQIEASENESGQLVEDYKSVLVDIKSLVREYIHSGDREYLNLLCSSLGITQR